MFLSKKFRITPFFVIFNVIIIYLLALFIKLGISFFFFLFKFLIILEVVDFNLWLIEILESRKIKIRRNVKEKAIEGEKLSVNITLNNKSSFLFINLCIRENIEKSASNIEHSEIIHIFHRGLFKISYILDCDKRGKYKLGPVILDIRDTLGFFSFSRIYNIFSVVYVYPEIFDIDSFPPLMRSNLPWWGIETRRVSGDEDEFFGVREYKQGDPIRRIHWLSTARKNKLIVKEFERFSFYKVSIMFVLNKDENIGVGKKSTGEFIIKIAASLSKYFIERNVSTEVIAHTGRFFHFPPNKGFYHLEGLMKFYASTGIESRIKIGEFWDAASSLITSNTNLFILTTEENISELKKIFSFSKYNISFIFIILLSSTFLSPPQPSKVGDLKISLKAKYFFISSNDNLHNLFSKI